MQIIDVDKLFENYFTEYVNKNKGKFTEEEWEDKVPLLYEEFSRTPFPQLSGKTPNTFYSGLSGVELTQILKEYVDKNMPVSDFLVREISKRGDGESLSSLIYEGANDELISYAISFLSDINAKNAVDVYFSVLTGNYASEHKEHVTEILCGERADEVKERVFSIYGNDKKVDEYLNEIVAGMKIDDMATKILIDGFVNHPNETALYSAYLAKYGDDRALPYLLERIESVADYSDFKELKYAIEALGGEYKGHRDFTTSQIKH